MAIITNSKEGDDEVTAPSAANATSRSDEDALAAVLERTGGPVPFLQVARERSGLFPDPTAATKVAALAKSARAQAEAEAEEKLVDAENTAKPMAIITNSQEEGGDEVTAPSAANATSRSDEDALAAVLERTGGPLPFLQGARERSALFPDPTAATKVAAMAKSARAQAEAEEKLVDAENTAKDGRRAREPNAENGLDLEKYSWTQELSEVSITVSIPQGTKSMFVVCEIEKNHLKVALKGHTPIIDGVLYQPVNVCDCFWTIEDGKLLSILLSKHKKEWWASVIRGDPELDIKKVKIMPSRLCDLDMDPEIRQALEKSKFDRHWRKIDLPTR